MLFYKQQMTYSQTYSREEVLSTRGSSKSAPGWMMLYFFCLNCGHYLLRPLRDELVLHYKLRQLPYFFTGTFICMLILLPVLNRLNRLGNERFLKIIHQILISNLLIFWLLLQFSSPNYYLHLAFFGWLSVFNLLSVSLFWGFITDLLNHQQAKVFFAKIALSGSLGAITGSVITFLWAVFGQPLYLIGLAVLMLVVVLHCIKQLQKFKAQIIVQEQNNSNITPSNISQQPTKNYLRQIAGLVLLYTLLSTFLYFEQAHLLAYSQSNDVVMGVFELNRTAVLALMAFGINGATLLIQLTLTQYVMIKRGMAYTLAVVPSLMIICLIVLSLAPMLVVLVISQIIHKTGNYALMRPARESLFTIIAPQQKYQIKLWIDLAVYRGGDVLGSWLFFTLLLIFGLDITSLTLLIIPIAYLWQWQSRKVGLLHEKLVTSHEFQNLLKTK